MLNERSAPPVFVMVIVWLLVRPVSSVSEIIHGSTIIMGGSVPMVARTNIDTDPSSGSLDSMVRVLL